MTITTRKERQKEELKGKILQAARELFMRRALKILPSETLLRRSSIPRHIYLYFKDKDDIFMRSTRKVLLLLNQYFRPLAHV